MPQQRTIGADVRSVLATGRGVPAWGAVLIAASVTLIGIGIEAGSGHQELGGIFAGFYAVGCLLAVFMVRRAGIFTAVIQPPLLLFVAVPLAYYLLHESSFHGLKDIAITCGYPLIERFPLMLFTSSAVLLVGLVRWYLAMQSPQPVTPARQAKTGVFAGLSTKLASASAGNGSVDENPGTRPARPRHVVDRPGASRSRQPEKRPARARHSRASAAEFADAPPPRRSRRPAMETERAQGKRRREGDRTPPPPRRDPRERRDYRRDQLAPRPPRGSRLEPHETGRGYQSHPTYGSYPPPPYDPRRRADRSSGDQHPVSRVRYRDVGPSDSDYRSR